MKRFPKDRQEYYWGRIDCPERRSCWHAIAGWLVIGVVVFIVVAEVIAFAHL